MKKMKKYIGLLLAAFMIANLCAAVPGQVKAEENVNEFNQKKKKLRTMWMPNRRKSQKKQRHRKVKR